MIYKFRIHVELVFDTQVARDSWYTRVKAGLANIRTVEGTAPSDVTLRTDEYQLPSSSVEKTF